MSWPEAAYRDALEWAKDHFPFQGWFDGHELMYETTARTVARYLPTGSRILDFGSGPCDKTAILSRMGYACSAVDDLGDHWHRQGANRERIMAFARDAGIDLRVAQDGRAVPFEDSSFDMLLLHDVLEHMHDSPRELLNDCMALVRERGFLFVTVPNAADIRKRLQLAFGRTNMPRYNLFYWHPGPWRGHVREYVKRDLRQLCQYLDLEVCQLCGTHQYLLPALSPIVRPAYRLATWLFRGWRDAWLLVARKNAGWQPRRGALDGDRLRAVLGRSTRYPY
jgi:SAM-dependent methyltransferase